jgi:hypothetical protein
LREAAADRAETVCCRAGSPCPTAPPPGPPPAHHLLLGDDPGGLAELLRRAFPRPEYRVQVAGSGPGGPAHAFTQSYDAIVLDLGPSEPSGPETYRQIRRIDPRPPDPPPQVARAGPLGHEGRRGGRGRGRRLNRRRPICSFHAPWMAAAAWPLLLPGPPLTRLVPARTRVPSRRGPLSPPAGDAVGDFTAPPPEPSLAGGRSEEGPLSVSTSPRSV